MTAHVSPSRPSGAAVLQTLNGHLFDILGVLELFFTSLRKVWFEAQERHLYAGKCFIPGGVGLEFQTSYKPMVDMDPAGWCSSQVPQLLEEEAPKLWTLHTDNTDSGSSSKTSQKQEAKPLPVISVIPPASHYKLKPKSPPSPSAVTCTQYNCLQLCYSER